MIGPADAVDLHHKKGLLCNASTDARVCGPKSPSIALGSTSTYQTIEMLFRFCLASTNRSVNVSVNPGERFGARATDPRPSWGPGAPVPAVGGTGPGPVPGDDEQAASAADAATAAAPPSKARRPRPGVVPVGRVSSMPHLLCRVGYGAVSRR
jgi:hypothetical protein